MTHFRTKRHRQQQRQSLRWWLGAGVGLGVVLWLARRWLGLQAGPQLSLARPGQEPAPAEPLTPPAADEPLAAPRAAVAEALAVPESELAHPAAEQPPESLAAPLAAEAAVQAGDAPAHALPLAAETQPAAAPGLAEDDLTAIDGIGPVRAGQLRKLGIATFAQLAAMDAEALRAAAREAGFNFNPGNPESWIEQAQEIRRT